ncbi:MAG: TIGR03618 family F420-dependent PPOX class oxidoreductase [Anaerolineae bacterium]|nr:TIGR03618 family F420-dependent PPOX class oxidoreductase [Anaerolineae bacterium]
MTFQVPDSHRDLLEKPLCVTLATVSPQGKPYTAVVWRKFDGQHFWIVTDTHTRKYKNLLANKAVSLVTLDPNNPYRYIEVRGTVEAIASERALELLDELTLAYMGKPHYFGDIEPAEEAAKYQGVILKIKPETSVQFG